MQVCTNTQKYKFKLKMQIQIQNRLCMIRSSEQVYTHNAVAYSTFAENKIRVFNYIFYFMGRKAYISKKCYFYMYLDKNEFSTSSDKISWF